ncbi:hypothetical protein [Microbacterium sp. NPDC057944]|uniref:hypothetical protein n=1 Tax=Microbacterium sp. NPDC057944 TaxID=3346286 RepID=UPI0036D7DAFF
MPEPVSASVRAELDQTPAWWDRQFESLVRKQIPRFAAWHEDHIIGEQRTHASTTVRRHCVDCGIEIDPYEEGP